MPQVYRICAAKYANTLFASSRPNRWNTNGKLVIYAAQSRALACLENVVHRSHIGTSVNFAVMVIDIDSAITVHSIPLNILPSNWYDISSYPFCQKLGDAWYNAQTSAVMAVPSSIIHTETVYVIHTLHPDFLMGKIKLVGQESFTFDPRIPG
jgi:RES domain-containing protein